MDMKLRVEAGAAPRDLCPVTVTVPLASVSTLTADGAPVLFTARGLDATQCELSFVVDGLAAGAARDYVAGAGEAPAKPGGLMARDEAGAVTIVDDDAVVTAYHYLDHKAMRPYWFPVLDPHGQRVTRSYPMESVFGEDQDHKHHRSLWVAYGDVNKTDDWSEEPKCGTQTHQGFRHVGAGGAVVTLDEDVCWRSHAGDPVLDERRLWRYWKVRGGARLLDLSVDLRPAAGLAEVIFGDTKEGGLCSVRVASSMDVRRGKGGRIENSRGGVDEGQTWGKRAEWCDYSGPVAGRTSGIAILDHPQSFRHPTWWHVRDYGLMTANCFAWSEYTGDKTQNGSHHLKAGETLSFRYRVYVHDGDAAAGAVARRWTDFATPPAVTKA